MSDEPLVTAHEIGLPYALLTPGYYPPRTGDGYGYFVEGSDDLLEVLYHASSSPLVAIDLETRGTAIWREDSSIVGIGLAWDTGSCYISVDILDDDSRRCLFEWIADPSRRFLAHNAYFDQGFLWRSCGLLRHPNFVACTFALYYYLSCEGFEGQSRGLKSAQIDLLGWPESNEVELDAWLVEHGYCNQNKTPSKSEMWRAPREILGKYCILDAESCYLLYTEVLEPVLRQWPALGDYLTQDVLPLIQLLIEQNYWGILVDRQALEEHGAQLSAEIKQMGLDFREIPEVKDYITTYEERMRRIFLGTEPQAKFKKRKIRTEPTKLKKDGTISKVWLTWQRKVAEDAATPDEIRADWIAWQVKRGKFERGELKEFLFNSNSDIQLRKLLYEHLGYEVIVTTDSGEPSTSEDALRQMGPVGKFLAKLGEKEKELTYVTSYLSLLTPENTLHPGWKVPGTLTGRLAGKEPNIQQVPKTRGTLQCFVPRPGFLWVDCDVNALEQVVMAELSRDPALVALYGPDAPQNDVYLWVGSQLPVIGPKIRAAGYDPDCPTPEGISSAKKEAKAERGIAKVVVLASSYGAGAKKIHKTLSLNGVKITMQEVYQIYDTYWELFAGIRDYEERLRSEWRRSGGYVVNGIGRPIGVSEKYLKDVGNRVCQSTGHDVLLLYIQIVRRLLDSEEIPWYPVIVDWHDEMIVEVAEAAAERTKYLMEVVAYQELNALLGWEMRLKGSAKIVDNLADAKLDE